MKKRIQTIQGKTLVQTDDVNSLKKHEINILEEGEKVTLQVRKEDGSIVEVAGGGSDELGMSLDGNYWYYTTGTSSVEVGASVIYSEGTTFKITEAIPSALPEEATSISSILLTSSMVHAITNGIPSWWSRSVYNPSSLEEGIKNLGLKTKEPLFIRVGKMDDGRISSIYVTDTIRVEYSEKKDGTYGIHISKYDDYLYPIEKIGILKEGKIIPFTLE